MRYRSGKIHVLAAKLCANGGHVDLALERHTRVQERAQALRISGGAHASRRRSPTRMETARKTPEPARLHRPQSEKGRDYPGLLGLRGVTLEAMPRRASAKE